MTLNTKDLGCRLSLRDGFASTKANLPRTVLRVRAVLQSQKRAKRPPRCGAERQDPHARGSQGSQFCAFLSGWFCREGLWRCVGFISRQEQELRTPLDWGTCLWYYGSVSSPPKPIPTSFFLRLDLWLIEHDPARHEERADASVRLHNHVTISQFSSSPIAFPFGRERP